MAVIPVLDCWVVTRAGPEFTSGHPRCKDTVFLTAVG